MAKMIAPILCIVPLATHCSVPKMRARLRRYTESERTGPWTTACA